MRTTWLIPAGLIALGACAACGGSSSETPFPLEPDFARMDAGGPPANAHYVVFNGAKPGPGEEEADAAAPGQN